MKLIVDAQLPESLCFYFEQCDCIHTNQLSKGNLTTDSQINSLSIKEQRVVITKDTDFYYSYQTNKKPYKLVLVKLGNMRLKEINKYFQSNAPKIIRILKSHSFIMLEKNKIKIIE
ncbi:MAG: DUF5615 family PIN-like protein [Prolixibacteraceae bacterium]|nr:DUF5615 family PIN-like protein [Prolixibacteraceae bacterium]